jgi:type IV secretion system protein VirD4
MIITDPKGEIYEKTSNMLRARVYQILLLNFRDPQNGNAWNPMSLPYQMYKSGNQDKAIELLDYLALNILYDDSNKNADPFWEKTSADYFSGVALGLFEDAKEDEININSISLATTVGEEKFGGSTYIKEYFAAKDPASAAAINASSTIMAPNETKGSILSVLPSL